MAPKQDADLFNKIIAEGRERQKNEALANAMLGGGSRRSSTPGTSTKNNKAPTGSLASRVGISKNSRVSSPLSRPSSTTPSNSFRNGNLLQSRPLTRTVSDSRVERRARAVETLATSDSSSNIRDQVNFRDSTSNGSGFSFRGQAQEWITVVAQNFAEGTTAADIESVLQPMVDEDVVCKIISARPTVVAEMQFKERINADKVVSTFNNKKADGRQLYVYVKDAANTPSGPRGGQKGPDDRNTRDDRSTRRGQEDETMDVDEDRRRYDEQRRHDEERRNERRAEPEYQDGRFGFDDRRDYDSRPARERDGRNNRGLYSDSIARGRRGGSSYRGNGGYRGRS